MISSVLDLLIKRPMEEARMSDLQLHKVPNFYCKRKQVPQVSNQDIKVIVHQWVHSLAVSKNKIGIIVKEEVLWQIVVLDSCQMDNFKRHISHLCETFLLLAVNKLQEQGHNNVELQLILMERSLQWRCVNLPTPVELLILKWVLTILNYVLWASQDKVWVYKQAQKIMVSWVQMQRSHKLFHLLLAVSFQKVLVLPKCKLKIKTHMLINLILLVLASEA